MNFVCVFLQPPTAIYWLTPIACDTLMEMEKIDFFAGQTIFPENWTREKILEKKVLSQQKSRRDTRKNKKSR